MRKFNFSAGPCTLPLVVLEEAQSEFVDYHGAGMSLLEMSHRSAAYDEVHTQAMAKAKAVFGAPDDFSVLFLGGGATLQFSMIPMNLLAPGQRGAVAVTGEWGGKSARRRSSSWRCLCRVGWCRRGVFARAVAY